MTSGVDKALKLIRNLPRVTLGNLRPLFPVFSKHKSRLGIHGGVKCGRGNKGQGQRNTLPPVGFEGGNTPFYKLIPKEPYYHGFHMRREYPPLSLHSLQRLIDLGRIDIAKPVDLTALCNTKVIVIDPSKRHYGINLIDEGADIFSARINIEVQFANEVVIAAIERCGGHITTRFFDIQSVTAMIDPLKHFKKGLIVPRCKLPPQDAIEYYSSAENRGYLADPNKINLARFELSQKYGYILPPDMNDKEMQLMLEMRKDPRQIWFGIHPGSYINLQEKTILKPSDPKLKEYYQS